MTFSRERLKNSSLGVINLFRVKDREEVLGDVPTSDIFSSSKVPHLGIQCHSLPKWYVQMHRIDPCTQPDMQELLYYYPQNSILLILLSSMIYLRVI